MKVSGPDVREKVEREDRGLRDKLLSKNFVNNDSHSRPCTPEYAEGWDRIFGKKQERSDSVDVVTPGCTCARIAAVDREAGIVTITGNAWSACPVCGDGGDANAG